MSGTSLARHALARLTLGLAGWMPLESPAGCMAGSVLFAFGVGWLLPSLAAAAPLPLQEALHDWTAGPSPLGWVHGAILVAGAAGIALFQARCLTLCYPAWFETDDGIGSAKGRRNSPLAAEIAGMRITEDDLKTSVLVTGVTGSSKTAGVLLPLLGQLFARYDGRDREAIGAFIPEVKGDLVDAAIYLAHRAGRSRRFGCRRPLSRADLSVRASLRRPAGAAASARGSGGVRGNPSCVEGMSLAAERGPAPFYRLAVDRRPFAADQSYRPLRRAGAPAPVRGGPSAG